MAATRYVGLIRLECVEIDTRMDMVRLTLLLMLILVKKDSIVAWVKPLKNWIKNTNNKSYSRAASPTERYPSADSEKPLHTFYNAYS